MTLGRRERRATGAALVAERDRLRHREQLDIALQEACHAVINRHDAKAASGLVDNAEATQM
jgi:hypothetical protein